MRRAACIFTHSITFVSFHFVFVFVFVFCFSSTTRDFVQTNYKDLKTVNPTFPFLVRECEGIEAKIWARYGKKKKKKKKMMMMMKPIHRLTLLLVPPSGLLTLSF